MQSLLKKLHEFLHPRPPEERVRAVLSETELTVTLSNGQIESMPRDQIREISIRTTDTGPFVEDVYWEISDGVDALYVPQASPDFSMLLEKFGTLPGFSHETFMRAM